MKTVEPMKTVPALLLSLATAFLPAEAAEIPQPDRGRVAELPGRPGTYRIEIDEPSADGRVRLPAGFPSVVRCERETPDGPRPAGFEVDPDGATLLPCDAGEPPALRVETADATGQRDDGRIAFLADGALAADGSIAWDYVATRWGRYAAFVTYSSVAAENVGATVDFGDGELDGVLKPTGAAERYATAAMGDLALATAGKRRVTLRLERPAGVRIRAVTLLPACEGTPPAQTGAEPILLHGRDATVRGTVLRYEPAEAKRTLGYWVRPTDAAEWAFTVATPGEYEVEVLQGCGAGQGGSEVAVTVAGRELPFVVEETGHFQNFVSRIVGRVAFPKAGRYELTVAPRRIAAKAALDLRQVRLLPVSGRR